MPRPTLKDTKDWETTYSSDLVTMERATLTLDGHDWLGGAYRVTIHDHESPTLTGPDGGPVLVSGRKKLFYGETAWSDAERMATDVDSNAIGAS